MTESPAIAPAAALLLARLKDPECLQQAIAQAPTQTRFERSTHWQAHSAAQGYTGLALVAGYAHSVLPDDGWDHVGHQFLLQAVDGVHVERLRPGLFTGLAGIAIAAHALASDTRRYNKLLGDLDRLTANKAIELAKRVLGADDGMPVAAFDVISGLAGVTSYLRSRIDKPILRDALRSCVQALASLATVRRRRPRWWTPPHHILHEPARRAEPYGNLNLGLAHGVPGILAALATSYAQGIDAPGTNRAIEHLADFLVEHQLSDDWGPTWPSTIPLRPDGRLSKAKVPTRSAWCYGAPGISLALRHASHALGRSDWATLAHQSITAAVRRPPAARRADSPSYCHGSAGLLHVAATLNTWAGTAASAELEALEHELMTAIDPKRPLGIAAVEPGGNRIDHAGLLDGSPGTALVLLSAATGAPGLWEHLFLVS